MYHGVTRSFDAIRYDAVVEDLYATVSKPGGSATSALAGRISSTGTEDVYASLESVTASSTSGNPPPPPPMPVRSYDKTLLPPTFRVQVDEGTDEQYEELPALAGGGGGGGIGRGRIGSRTFDIDLLDASGVPPPLPTGARRPSEFALGVIVNTSGLGPSLPAARTPVLDRRAGKEEKKANRAAEKQEAADAKAAEKVRATAEKVRAKEQKAEEKARLKEGKRAAKEAAKKK